MDDNCKKRPMENVLGSAQFEKISRTSIQPIRQVKYSKTIVEDEYEETDRMQEILGSARKIVIPGCIK
ncbi:hypothetical protein KIN20_015526 [Parelaphostrongylus tenuis]|uniref:Uncharacterized protein n=1 Tax=Parelaphostrongylus tenuis TaxID=148309 RepID=A0AAD5N4A5_PARTN|nr:hypothetical protein KIN20_015526 [Parelaphostrongylus tenuis]